MLLYRYFASHVLDTLRDKRLKVARISELNDPFECRFVAAGEMTREDIREYRAKQEDIILSVLRDKGASSTEIKQAQRRMKRVTNHEIRNSLEKSKVEAYTAQEEVLDEDLRVICFSALAPEKHDEILMWAHYTNGHRGGRIGFEIPEEKLGTASLKPMNYDDKRVILDLTNFGLPNGPELISTALLASTERKSKSWKYEDEYRLFTGSEASQKDGGLEFFPFDKSWVRRVDLGLRFPPGEKEQVLTLLQSECPNVELYQADFHPTNYALVYKSVA
jgi:hypothetical protein